MNYQKQLDEIINSLDPSAPKPTLLLHACCGPCSSYVLEYLAKYFDITVYYYNPNIYPREEYNRRLDELKNLYTRFPPALENKIKVVEADYNPDDFYNAINIAAEPNLATEPERGERCRRCYELRLKMSYKYAKNHGFQYFCTTLSISPFKDAEKINTIGFVLQNAQKPRNSSDLQHKTPENTQESELFTRANYNNPTYSEATAQSELSTPNSQLSILNYQFSIPKWLPSDFKKKGGFKRSLELSEEYDLYRQQYCGCVYSMRKET